MTLNIHKGKFKDRFSNDQKGCFYKVMNGKSGEIVGYFGKDLKNEKPFKRKLGFFIGHGIKINKEDLQWTEEKLEEMGI